MELRYHWWLGWHSESAQRGFWPLSTAAGHGGSRRRSLNSCLSSFEVVESTGEAMKLPPPTGLLTWSSRWPGQATQARVTMAWEWSIAQLLPRNRVLWHDWLIGEKQVSELQQCRRESGRGWRVCCCRHGVGWWYLSTAGQFSWWARSALGFHLVISSSLAPLVWSLITRCSLIRESSDLGLDIHYSLAWQQQWHTCVGSLRVKEAPTSPESCSPSLPLREQLAMSFYAGFRWKYRFSF